MPIHKVFRGELFAIVTDFVHQPFNDKEYEEKRADAQPYIHERSEPGRIGAVASHAPGEPHDQRRYHDRDGVLKPLRQAVKVDANASHTTGLRLRFEKSAACCSNRFSRASSPCAFRYSYSEGAMGTASSQLTFFVGQSKVFNESPHGNGAVRYKCGSGDVGLYSRTKSGITAP